jgi:hypothetical protein
MQLQSYLPIADLLFASKSSVGSGGYVAMDGHRHQLFELP